MADYTVIAEVGQTLIDLLWEEIRNDDQVNNLIDSANKLSLESPYDLRENDMVKLSIYLYRVVEDAHTKNQWPVMGNGGRLRKPPLTLDLYYLITPLVGSSSPRDQQILLGKVMQAFYDRAIISGGELTGSLAEEGEPLRIILNPVSLEESTRVWQALEMSYRLSVCYVVRVAMVNSRIEQTGQPVLEKTGRYGEKAEERAERANGAV